MRILFCGASSTTGLHFVQALHKRGHILTCTFTKPNLNDYDGIRKKRVQIIETLATTVFGIKFGDERFLTFLKHTSFDVYIHHMTWTEGYKSSYYDEEKAFTNNTNALSSVERILYANGCTTFVCTGSIFEGLSNPLVHTSTPFEALGRAKRKSTLYIKNTLKKLAFRYFVISNPFGRYDQVRFVEYLNQSWIRGEVPLVQTPNYIRDNIPLPYLSQCYVDFIEGDDTYCAPSGFVLSNAAFAQKIAHERHKRGYGDAPIAYNWSHAHTQPMELFHNTPKISSSFQEHIFWDQLFSHHQDRFAH